MARYVPYLKWSQGMLDLILQYYRYEAIPLLALFEPLIICSDFVHKPRSKGSSLPFKVRLPKRLIYLRSIMLFLHHDFQVRPYGLWRYSL